MASTTYALKSVVGSFTHPVAGTFTFAGQIGVGSIEIAMSTDRSVQDVAGDGAVMTSAVAGRNGSFTLSIQQTSELDQFLLAYFNILDTAFNLDDVSQWTTAAVFVQDLVTGNQHILSGVSPTKPPNRPYGSRGAMLSWVLLASDIVNL